MLLGTESPTYLRAATAAIAAQLPDARIVAAQGQAHQAIDTDPNSSSGWCSTSIPLRAGLEHQVERRLGGTPETRETAFVDHDFAQRASPA